MARPAGPWWRSSKNTWYATLPDGRKVSLGVKEKGNKAGAWAAWDRLRNGGGERADPPAAVVTSRPPDLAIHVVAAAPPSPAVAEVINAFLADAEGRVKAKTLKDYRNLLAAFRAAYGHLPAKDLTTVAAEAFARRPGWSDSTRHDFLGLLSSVFRWAVRARLLAASPLEGLRRPPKASRGAGAVVTEEDHERIVGHAAGDFRVLLELLWLTGARPSEIMSVRAGDFLEDEGLVLLEAHKTAHKDGKRRVIYLPAEAQALLRRQKGKYAGEGGYLIRNAWGGRLSLDSAEKLLKKACDRAGVHKTLYGYRHGWATEALVKGLPEAYVAELLGHKGTGMLQKHYGHLGHRAGVLKDAVKVVR
jgi:integrase